MSSHETRVSDSNSSLAPLGIGGVFTGSAEYVAPFNEAQIFVKTDVVSAANGISIEQSVDGTVWDLVQTYEPELRDETPGFYSARISVSIEAAYLRVVYTNGAGAQSVFRLQTIVKKTADEEMTYEEDSQYIVDGDLTADIDNAEAIDCRRYRKDGLLTLEFIIDGTNAPQGQLYVQGSRDGTNWIDLTLTEGKVFSDNASVTHVSTNPDLKMIDLNGPVVTSRVLLTLADLLPFIRVRYHFDAGGFATGLDVAYTLSK